MCNSAFLELYAAHNERVIMGPEDEKILNTIDMMALALTDYHHKWTIGQRGAYEEAVSILKTRHQTGAVVFPALDEQCAAKTNEAAEQHTTQAKAAEALPDGEIVAFVKWVASLSKIEYAAHRQLVDVIERAQQLPLA